VKAKSVTKRMKEKAFAASVNRDTIINAASIAAFRARQAAAFAAERDAWERAGEFEPRDEATASPDAATVTAPVGGSVVGAPMTSSVWKVAARPGDVVDTGHPLVILEAMKTEMHVTAPGPGVVLDVLVIPGDQVDSGRALVVLGPVA
ncbi:MAG TPA: biotin/lipoyl-containing protein, partial [Acidimicrobiales bacterium]